MAKLMLVLAIATFGATMYFFFFLKAAFYGSLLMMLCLVFNLIYAMMATVNKLPDDLDNKDK